MSDGFDDAAIKSNARWLHDQARANGEFAAAILLVASSMLAATGNRAKIAESLEIFSQEVWTAASDTPDAIAEADAFLARIRSAEGRTDA